MDATIDPIYKSRSQMVRVITERWAGQQLYCCACSSDSLTAAPTNAQAIDFICPNCTATYQLKSGSTYKTDRVLDAGYNAMIRAIRNDATPNLLVMHYSRQWQVQNLLLVPRFFFTESAVEARKPLSPTARRAGYVGCNILLSAIAPDGKLRLVDNGVSVSPSEARRQYEKVRPLENLNVSLRGWALDVLTVIRRLRKEDFTLAEVYVFAPLLAQMHPMNNHVEPKIRQQLQVLRDAGLIEFVRPGKYRLIA